MLRLKFKFKLRLVATIITVFALMVILFLIKSYEKPKIIQFIPDCACSREYFYPLNALFFILHSNQRNTIRTMSSCNDPGSFHEPNQKVISYTMYFKNRAVDHWLEELFLKGLQSNLETMERLYPEYSMRLYTNLDFTGSNDSFCKILCKNPRLLWCDIRKTPSLGDQMSMYFRMWRFLPLGDSTVDILLSRDIDSVLTLRETYAVAEWLQNSSRAIHVMRDYSDGHDTAILAGMWGASNTRLGLKWAKDIREKLIKERLDKQDRYDTYFDQACLAEAVFFPAKSAILAHDSYNCRRWSSLTELRPFPVNRNVTGGDVAGMHNYMELPPIKCPVECRPDYGKDWEFC